MVNSIWQHTASHYTWSFTKNIATIVKMSGLRTMVSVWTDFTCLACSIIEGGRPGHLPSNPSEIECGNTFD